MARLLYWCVVHQEPIEMSGSLQSLGLELDKFESETA
jgi:hypothetical protein